MEYTEKEGACIKDGFDYDLQVWVVDHIVQRCGHPEAMSSPEHYCCNARELAGQDIREL